MAIMGSKAVAGSWDLGQASGRWAEAPACGSHLILITAPILATKDPHAFPTCCSELCTCSSHCLECPSQPLWGLFGLSFKHQLNVTSSLTWFADWPTLLPLGSHGTLNMPLLALITCQAAASPHRMVVPSRQEPNRNDFCASRPVRHPSAPQAMEYASLSLTLLEDYYLSELETRNKYLSSSNVADHPVLPSFLLQNLN